MKDEVKEPSEATEATGPALLRWFPELRTGVPWVSLTSVPSPVHRLTVLGRALGMDDLWLKRDDQCGLRYGGNKPRKLEYLLGHALARRAKTIITFGALGSNHTLATAIYGRMLV